AERSTGAQRRTPNSRVGGIAGRARPTVRNVGGIMATGNRLSGALFAVAACGLILLACAPPQVGSPTAAPAKPAEAARPAEPAPRAEPSPAGPAQPAPRGAVTPAPAAGKPTAQPAAFDERAVADFYRDKIVRIVVGTGAGGLYDVAA